MAECTVSQHFEGRDPIVKSIYERLLKESRKFGKVVEDPKKTSIHLNNKSAFAGVATQKAALVLTIKSSSPIQHARIKKGEQVSASRYHQEVKLTSPVEVDSVLMDWLREAYSISG